MWLVVTFLFSSVLLFFFGSEFLALIFLIIYVGAIAVLFLFAFMLLNFKLKNFNRKKNNSYLSIFSFSLFILIFYILVHQVKGNQYNIGIFNFNSDIENLIFIDKFYIIFLNWFDIFDSLNELNIFSILLYDFFILEFLLVGFILLSVLLGVVYLTNSYQNNFSLDQSIFKQISVNSSFFSNK
jgi:NADH:ubiquinone oxidoreductase subunit 6 (subunit J)